MVFTKEQENEGRRIARDRLSNGPLYYTGQWAGAPRQEHTEETLWPYCVPIDQTNPHSTVEPTIIPHTPPYYIKIK